MRDDNGHEIARLEADLACIWMLLDDLFAGFSPTDWRRPYGPDWVFADLPYHLGYVDRLATVEPLRFGADIPSDKRLSLPSPSELNAWNDAQLALRPAGFTVAQSLAEMRSGRNLVSRELAAMSDADLGKPVWFSLLNLTGIPRLLRSGEVRVNDIAALQSYGAFCPRIDLAAARPEAEAPRPVGAPSQAWPAVAAGRQQS